MEYNTQREHLPMPEYGRAVQEMVDYAVGIADRTERQRCAETIVDIMSGMFPSLKDVDDYRVGVFYLLGQIDVQGVICIVVAGVVDVGEFL